MTTQIESAWAAIQVLARVAPFMSTLSLLRLRLVCRALEEQVRAEVETRVVLPLQRDGAEMMLARTRLRPQALNCVSSSMLHPWPLVPRTQPMSAADTEQANCVLAGLHRNAHHVDVELHAALLELHAALLRGTTMWPVLRTADITSSGTLSSRGNFEALTSVLRQLSATVVRLRLDPMPLYASEFGSLLPRTLRKLVFAPKVSSLAHRVTVVPALYLSESFVEPTLDALPPMLHSLHLTSAYSQPLLNLPASLQTLRFTDCYHAPIIWPTGLRKLGWCGCSGTHALPQSLTTLALQRWDPTKCALPKALERLSVWALFAPVATPEALSVLQHGDMVRALLPATLLPATLRYLELVTCTTVTAVEVPPLLETLYLGFTSMPALRRGERLPMSIRAFACESFAHVTRPNPPPHVDHLDELRFLRLSYGYYEGGGARKPHPLPMLPPSLTCLHIQDSYAAPLPVLPASLVQLAFGARSAFDQTLDGVLPQGLKALRLGNRFNHALRTLPDSIEVLAIGDGYRRVLSFLPARRLTHLRVGSKFKQSPSEWLPRLQQLELLDLHPSCRFVLSPADVAPLINLRYLRAETNADDDDERIPWRIPPPEWEQRIFSPPGRDKTTLFMFRQ